MNTLALPSTVTITANSLTFNGNPSDEELFQTYETLLLAEGSTLFWFGDFLNKIEILKGTTYDKICGKSNYSNGTLRTAKYICAAIKPEKRVNGMSYSIHKEAYQICKDPDKAVEFVRMAKEEGLSVSDMRKAIRISQATEPQEEDVTLIDNKELSTALDSIINLKNYLSKVKDLDANAKAWILAALRDLLELGERVLR